MQRGYFELLPQAVSRRGLDPCDSEPGAYPQYRTCVRAVPQTSIVLINFCLVLRGYIQVRRGESEMMDAVVRAN